MKLVALYEQFKDKGITKILTIEASGIAPAIIAALHLMCHVYLRKKQNLAL